MRAATAGFRLYARAMELVKRGVVFQGYLMRCALISRVLASALLYPCWASAAMVLGVS